MSARPRVVIVGAGFGGLGCAQALVAAKTTEAADVTVLDQKTDFTIGGTWQFAVRRALLRTTAHRARRTRDLSA